MGFSAPTPSATAFTVEACHSASSQPVTTHAVRLCWSYCVFMGQMGDLMELVDGAPLGLRTLSGSLWKWTHHARSRRAIDELSRRGGGAVSHFGFGGPTGETSDEHLRVWLAPPDRWRIESDNRIDLKDGVSRWIGGPSHITKVDRDSSSLDDTEVGILIRPGAHLFGVLRFEVLIEDEVAGRRCWRSVATTEISRHNFRVTSLGMQLGGIDHSFWFDAETGIVLRHVGLIDNEPCAIAELKDLAINQPVPDEDFKFISPPDATVERQVDQLIRMAELREADLTGVDRTDPEAVRTAMSDVMRPHQPTPESRREMQRAKHIPVGGPPEDEVAARLSIEYAYSHHDETDETGELLVNVQNGVGLVEALKQARCRIPGSPEDTVKVVVNDIKFLRADEAVVWFSIDIDGNRLGFVNGREGRAVLEGERWLVEHATLVDLIGMAGVVVRPPSP
jgi:outer membrane lipoprotein-sorting protein